MLIREKFKQIAKQWIPPSILYSIRNQLIHTQPLKVKKSIACNEKFHDIHKGKRCFILATGPSVARQNLEPLANEICISVGEFYLHSSANKIKPKYHIESPMHPPFRFEVLEKLFENIGIYYKHHPHIFLGNSNYEFSYSKYLERTESKIESEFTYINYGFAAALDEYNNNDESLWDITRTPFSPRTVVYSAIQVAAYMGFSKIYLLGCDHDYLNRYFSNTFGSTHFYSEEKSVLRDSELNSIELLDAFTLENWFKEYYYRWMQYRLMNKYLSNRNQYIYNATDGGMLDVFPRVRFQDLF